MRLLFACLACLATFGTSNALAAGGRHFYVDPAGSDHASGSSTQHPWRTVARVNRATLRPGDTVSFRAGRMFDGAALAPRRSGTSGAPIVFNTYGSGRAVLRQGVVLFEVSWLTFRHFAVRGPAEGFGSRGGSGAQHIDIVDNTISSVERGVNSPNPADQDWLIANNDIFHTGDSGVIAQGGSFTISGNKIRNTGEDPDIHYGKHGIYSKSANVRILNNVITDFSAEGVSTRFPNALIANNIIRGGESGIGYYRDSGAAGGTTTICGNTISSVNDGVYIGPDGSAGATDEHFRVMDNVIRSETGRGVDAPADKDKVLYGDNDFRQAPAAARSPRLAAPCTDDH